MRLSAPRVLFVKLSSLGDVIHHMPAISDLRAHRPEIVIDWAVEEAYAPLVRLDPAVLRTVPIALRRLRSHLLSPAAWGTLSGAADGLRNAFEIRRWKNGDRFQPIGMKGTKKISDFVADQKISSSGKKEHLVLTNTKKIVWVIGLRIDDKFKVKPESRKILKLIVADK